jgi:hypothetical protein
MIEFFPSITLLIWQSILRNLLQSAGRAGMKKSLTFQCMSALAKSDADGLDLWKRNGGTIRCENYHQKLDSAIGPWAVGACTAHSIMVLRTFLYNVSTGISRCGERNFGHPVVPLLFGSNPTTYSATSECGCVAKLL